MVNEDMKVASGDVKVASGDVKVASGDVKVASGDASVASGDSRIGEEDNLLWNEQFLDTYIEEETSGCGDVSNKVIATKEDMISIEKNKYKNYYSYKTTYTKSKVLMTKNYRQKTLNAGFKREYKTKVIKNTCSMVAGTSTILFFNDNVSTYKTQSNSNRVFQMLVLIGMGNGSYTVENGTKDKEFYKIIRTYYNNYSKSYCGHFVQNVVDSKVERSIKAGKPIVGHFHTIASGHSMTICGYYDITTTYKKLKSSKEQKKTVRYYVVNDGWHDCAKGNDRIQYIEGKYLKSATDVR